MSLADLWVYIRTSLYLPSKNSATKQKCACLLYSDVKDLPSSRIHNFTPEASKCFVIDGNSLVNFRRRPVNTRFTEISSACVLKLQRGHNSL